MIFSYFQGNVSLDKVGGNPFAWLSQSGWNDLSLLSSLNASFANVLSNMKVIEDQWRAWASHDTPELESMPANFSKSLTLFEQICMLRCLRTDRIISAMTKFVAETLGAKLTIPPVLDLVSIYEQTTPESPVIFTVTSGADPISSLYKLADKIYPGANKIKLVSLGQGEITSRFSHLTYY